MLWMFCCHWHGPIQNLIPAIHKGPVVWPGIWRRQHPPQNTNHFKKWSSPFRYPTSNLAIGSIPYFGTFPHARRSLQPKSTDRFWSISGGCKQVDQPQWWVLGATGLTFDGVHFIPSTNYLRSKPTQDFLLLCWHWLWNLDEKSMALTFNTAFYGRSNLDNGDHRIGMAHVFLLGFNLYWNNRVKQVIKNIICKILIIR